MIHVVDLFKNARLSYDETLTMEVNGANFMAFKSRNVKHKFIKACT